MIVFDHVILNGAVRYRLGRGTALEFNAEQLYWTGIRLGARRRDGIGSLLTSGGRRGMPEMLEKGTDIGLVVPRNPVLNGADGEARAGNGGVQAFVLGESATGINDGSSASKPRGRSQSAQRTKPSRYSLLHFGQYMEQ